MSLRYAAGVLWHCDIESWDTPGIPGALTVKLLTMGHLPYHLTASCVRVWAPHLLVDPQRAAYPTGLDSQQGRIKYRLSCNKGEDCLQLAVSQLLGRYQCGPSKTAAK